MPNGNIYGGCPRGEKPEESQVVLRHQGPASNGLKSIRNATKLQQRIPQNKSLAMLSHQIVGERIRGSMLLSRLLSCPSRQSGTRRENKGPKCVV
jgi:hypothetical protein